MNKAATKAPRTPRKASSSSTVQAATAQALGNGVEPFDQDVDASRTVDYNPEIIGSTGLRQYGGFVVEEFVKELKGVRGANTYKEMADNDPVIGALLFAIEMLIRQTKFEFQAADKTTKAEADKDFVEEVFGDMSSSFSDMITEICTMFTYGYAPMEIVWKKRGGPDKADPKEHSKYSDGKVGIRNLSLRAQTSVVRWAFDPEDGGVMGVWQQPIAGPMVFIPITKMLLFRTRNERNNPEGRSILRNAYRPWFFKKRIEEIEGIGIERDLAGLPVALIPGSYLDINADAPMKKVAADWKRLVTNVRRDRQEGILMPSDRDIHGNPLFDFKLLTSGGSRAIDTTKIVDRYDNRITATVLADFIMLGSGGKGGSHALSQNKTEIFTTAIEAFLDNICDTVTRHLLPRLWSLNGKDEETMPKLTHGDIERKDLAGLAALLTALAGAGATLFPDPDLENHIREEAGLPPAPEDGEGWGAPDPTLDANMGVSNPANNPATSGGAVPGVTLASGKATATPQPVVQPGAVQGAGKTTPQNGAQPAGGKPAIPKPTAGASKPASGPKSNKGAK